MLVVIFEIPQILEKILTNSLQWEKHKIKLQFSVRSFNKKLKEILICCVKIRNTKFWNEFSKYFIESRTL